MFVLLAQFIQRIGCVPLGLNIQSAREAEDGEYAFVVRLERRIILEFDENHPFENIIHICTCVALSPSWALTAGHCIHSAAPDTQLTDYVRTRTHVSYGSHNVTTAEVISTILHPNFHDPLFKMENDIGLLRTEIMRLKQFAHISETDISSLSGQEVIIGGYRSTAQHAGRPPLQVLGAAVVRCALPARCAAPRRAPSGGGACATDAGGPVLLATGVVAINTISLETIQLCSAVSKGQPIGMDIITSTKPYIKWIEGNIKRDQLLLT
uniref:Peptidase S1 domain-containing protein n=1 Tax=Heliothis virescens TaxID=7102 RepID=A0A2A4JV43_HELVI